MRTKSHFINGFGGLGVAGVTARWMATLEYKAAYYDETVDPAHPEFRGPAIFLVWHEYIPFLFYLRGGCNIALLLSRHQDAEWLAKGAALMGFETIRGSTNRGGVRALRELFAHGRVRNLAITPDGPRGPRRQLAPGAVYLSSRLQIPLVAIGLGYQRPWRMPTWDKFAIPRPYERARGVASPFIQIPPGLDKGALEQHRQQVERQLNQLSRFAEDWASSGARVHGERILRRQGQSRKSEPRAWRPPSGRGRAA